MMFKKQARAAIESSLISAKWQAEAERMEETANRLALYSDDYETIIRDVMKTLFHKDNYDRLYYHVNGSQNILKRVVNELSMVYKTEATRTLSVKSDRWEAIKSETAMDVRMRRANRLTNLLNDTLVRVAVRGDRIVYDIITPDICSVVQSADDPTRMESCVWLRTSVNTPSDATVEYEYVDVDGWWVVLDKEFRWKETLYDPATYPYRDADGRPLMTIVPIHRVESESAFWDQDSGRDLYNAAVMMGVKMTQFDNLFKTSSFKQPYVIGGAVPSGQVMDPTTVLQVPDTDPNQTVEIGTLDMQTDIGALAEALTFQLNTVINNYGISADMWTLSISEMSGRALKIKNRALLEQREEQIPTYREAEQRLFEAVRAVNNAHASFMGWETIPENAELEVDFAEVEFPEDPNYEIDLAAKRLKAGLISPGQFYMAFNKDVKDEAEAEKKWLENLSKLQTTRKANPSLDEVLNYILKDGGANGDMGGEAEGDEGGAGGKGAGAKF